MRGNLKILAVVGAAMVAVALWGQAARAQALPQPLTVQLVVTGGTPTSAITIHQACSPGGGTKDFTNAMPGTVGTTDIGVNNDCIVTATATGGATTVTYSCTANPSPNNMACGPAAAHNEVTSGASGAISTSGATVVVTLTFVPPPPPPPVVTPARFTG
jgi:hypothetical protein